MQVIIALRCTPEKYVRAGLVHRIRSPPRCPGCGARGPLRAHDFYPRATTDSSGHVITIRVRRFLCRKCGVTVGCLPSFVQPYRLVNSATIEKAFLGDCRSPDVLRHQDLLRRYWVRFHRWAPQLRRLTETASRPAPPGSGKILLLWLLTVYDDFAGCTHRITRDFGTTCFGQYRCHKPPPPATTNDKITRHITVRVARRNTSGRLNA